MMAVRPPAGCVFEELAHTAEIGLRLSAPTAEILFECAAYAMFSLLQAEPNEQRPAVERTVVVQAPDAENLLVDWLNELLYLHETDDAIFAGVTVQSWSPTELVAQARGWRPRTSPSMHIKAVTYHQLRILQQDGEWHAQVFFDI